MIKIYLPKGTINDATDYYITLIESAISARGVDHVRVSSAKDIRSRDHVLTIVPSSVLVFILAGKKVKIINWFQGVGPEEYKLLHQEHKLKAKLVPKLLELIERYVLKTSTGNIFVSESMREHYQNKYRLKLDKPYAVVPCYNKPIDPEAFTTQDKYRSTKFVYAGGLYAWQSIQKTLEVFKLVEQRLPEAELTILTQDVQTAQSLIQSYGLVKANAKYVPLEEIDDELSKYKYGFLIRDDNIVNRVATPTKMNTYLANGVIPIYTNVIDDFEDNIDLQQYCVKFSPLDALDTIVDLIITHHQSIIDPNEIYQCYKTLFDEYYSDSRNTANMINMLKKIALHKGTP